MQSWGREVSEDRARAKREKEAAKKEGMAEPPEKKQKTEAGAGPASPAVNGDGTASAAKGEADKKKELEKLPKTDKVLIGDKVSWAIVEALGEDNCEVRRSMVEEKKAVKTPVSFFTWSARHVIS